MDCHLPHHAVEVSGPGWCSCSQLSSLYDALALRGSAAVWYRLHVHRRCAALWMVWLWPLPLGTNWELVASKWHLDQRFVDLFWDPQVWPASCSTTTPCKSLKTVRVRRQADHFFNPTLSFFDLGIWIQKKEKKTRWNPQTRMLTRILTDNNKTCHIFWAHLWDTPTYLTHWLSTIAPHSRWTFWLDTLIWHSCRTLLLDTLVGHSCRTLLVDTLVLHSCLTRFLDTFVGRSYLTLL